MSYWAVAQTITNAEEDAAERLRIGKLPDGYRFQTFVPLTKERRRVRGVFKRDNFPVFPGYIFFEVTGFWWPVLTCAGVIRVVLNGEAPAQLPSDWVEQKMAEQKRRGYAFVTMPARFFPGQTVRVERPGSTYGLKGTYIGPSKRDCVRVLLDMLGRAVPTDIPERELAAA